MESLQCINVLSMVFLVNRLESITCFCTFKLTDKNRGHGFNS